MSKNEKSDYDIQAEDFLKKTGTEFSFKFLKHDHYFNDDKEKRDIYKITLKRGERSYTFNFGQSIACSGRWFVWDMPVSFQPMSRSPNNTRKILIINMNPSKISKNKTRVQTYAIIIMLIALRSAFTVRYILLLSPEKTFSFWLFNMFRDVLFLRVFKFMRKDFISCLPSE